MAASTAGITKRNVATHLSQTSQRNMHDSGDEGDGDNLKAAGETEGKDIDPDALAFIKAKRKVDDLQRAKKMEKKIGAH